MADCWRHRNGTGAALSHASNCPMHVCNSARRATRMAHRHGLCPRGQEYLDAVRSGRGHRGEPERKPWRRVERYAGIFRYVGGLRSPKFSCPAPTGHPGPQSIPRTRRGGSPNASAPATPWSLSRGRPSRSMCRAGGPHHPCPRSFARRVRAWGMVRVARRGDAGIPGFSSSDQLTVLIHREYLHQVPITIPVWVVRDPMGVQSLAG